MKMANYGEPGTQTSALGGRDLENGNSNTDSVDSAAATHMSVANGLMHSMDEAATPTTTTTSGSLPGVVYRRRLFSPSPAEQLAFIVSALLALVAVKYQSKADSPFDTHPKTTMTAVVSLLVYYLAYNIELRSFNDDFITNVQVVRRVKTFLGTIILTSVSSILLSDWAQPILYVVCILFAIGSDLYKLGLVQNSCRWVQEVVQSLCGWVQEVVQNLCRWVREIIINELIGVGHTRQWFSIVRSHPILPITTHNGNAPN